MRQEAAREFSIIPDWRAEIPYWLLLPKALLLIGLPAWFAWTLVTVHREFDLQAMLSLALVALWGAQHIVFTAERTRTRLRRMCERSIKVDEKGLCLLPPYGKWRTFPWNEITELQITTAGGLFGAGFISVEAGGITCAIPPWVRERRELVRQIRRRADLCRVRRSWWATIFRTDSIFTETWDLRRFPESDESPA